MKRIIAVLLGIMLLTAAAAQAGEPDVGFGAMLEVLPENPIWATGFEYGWIKKGDYDLTDELSAMQLLVASCVYVCVPDFSFKRDDSYMKSEEAAEFMDSYLTTPGTMSMIASLGEDIVISHINTTDKQVLTILYRPSIDDAVAVLNTQQDYANWFHLHEEDFVNDHEWLSSSFAYIVMETFERLAETMPKD